MKTTEQRFHEKVAPPNGAGCRLWTACANKDGYGRLWLGGRIVLAHRFAWALANGLIHAGLCVLHKCDTPRCCNPEHLFLGTRAVNNADRDAKGRQLGARGSENGRAKLTDADVVKVFHASGTLKNIGARYGLGKSQVGRIKRCVNWTHATEGLAAT